MNVAGMKEWLNQFPDDTVVEIVYHTRGSGYYDQGGNATTVEFDPDPDDWGFCKKGHFYHCTPEGKSLLLIGAYDE